MNTQMLFARRNVRGFEFRQGIEQFAHQMAAALDLSGIAVMWDEIPTACINQYGRMVLAAVRDDATIDRAVVVRYAGFVVHELLHRKYSTFTVNGDTSYLRALHNAVEDAWIERTAIAAGLTGNIRGLLTELVEQIVAESMTKVADWTDPAVYPFALAVHARGYGVNVPIAEGLLPIFDEAARRVDSCQSSTDTLHVAEWVYDQLQNLKDEPEQQPEQQDGEEGEEGDQSQDGEEQDEGSQSQGEQSSGDQSQDGEGDGQDGEGEAQSGSQPGDQQAGDQTPGKARRPTDKTEAMQVEPDASAPKGSEGSSYSSDSVLRGPTEHIMPRPMHELSATVPGRLRHEVRRIFDNSAMTLFTRGRKAGSINPAALHQAGTTGRVFQQRRDVEGIDSAVAIVLDCSGSMRRQIERVAGVGALLIETLQSAQVATAVLTFDDAVSVPVPFGTRVQKARDILSRIHVAGGTNDFAAIRHATDLLLARGEQRKVVFVVTDGMGWVDAAIGQIKAARNLGIEVIGIGIGIDVSRVYGEKTSLRVDDIKELGGAVFSKIKVAA